MEAKWQSSTYLCSRKYQLEISALYITKECVLFRGPNSIRATLVWPPLFSTIEHTQSIYIWHLNWLIYALGYLSILHAHKEAWKQPQTLKLKFRSFTHIWKLRHYKKATKFEKNLPPVLTKQLFYSVALIQVGYFFQIFQAFSEKLDFNIRQIKKVFAYTFFMTKSIFHTVCVVILSNIHTYIVHTSC